MKTKRKEIQIPWETVRDLLIAHLFAISYLNDDQTVVDLKWKRGVDLKNMMSFDLVIRADEDLPNLPSAS